MQIIHAQGKHTDRREQRVDQVLRTLDLFNFQPSGQKITLPNGAVAELMTSDVDWNDIDGDIVLEICVTDKTDVTRAMSELRCCGMVVSLERRVA